MEFRAYDEGLFGGRAHSGRRGVVAIQVAIALPVLIAFAALTIDIGRLYVAKTQLQVAADAAAMAGPQHT